MLAVRFRILSWRLRLLKIELCGRLNVLWLFHVGHVVRYGQSFLSLDWYYWLSCKGRMNDFLLPARVVVRTSNLKISRHRLAYYAPKSVPQVQLSYFSWFNQSYHWFVALSMPQSFLKPMSTDWGRLHVYKSSNNSSRFTANRTVDFRREGKTGMHGETSPNPPLLFQRDAPCSKLIPRMMSSHELNVHFCFICSFELSPTGNQSILAV